MFANIFPNFGKGRILKKEMLENLRDFPRNFLDIYYKDYSNGIISGAEVCIGGNTITILKGIIKHDDRIYILDKEFDMPYYPTNKEVLIKIKFLDNALEGDFNVYESKIFIDENSEVGENEIEMGRFKLREGALLRSEYRDFYDFSTEFNTVNIINVEYSCLKKSTISPVILKYFSNIIFKHGSENIYDVSFAMQCMNENLIDRQMILYYISNRLGIDYKDYSNMQIYKYLTTIVKETESGIKRKVELRPNRPSRIIVD
ncbi:UNVERIFIED_CONTAM: hypothetical protein Cloal_3508 [Acetivibrio alkalicellulosi]